MLHSFSLSVWLSVSLFLQLLCCSLCIVFKPPFIPLAYIAVSLSIRVSYSHILSIALYPPLTLSAIYSEFLNHSLTFVLQQAQFRLLKLQYVGYYYYK